MAFTPEDIQQLIEALKPMITDTASQAAAAHVTKRNQSFEDKLEQRLSQTKTTPVEEDQPEKQTLTTRMNKLEEENKRLIAQNKSEKEANIRAQMRSQTESVLLKNKTNPELLKAAMAQLLYEDKLIELDESGNSFFKTNVNGYDEKLSIEDGVSGWLKSNGKAFILQSTAKGAGLRSQTARPTIHAESEITQDEADEALIAALRRAR
jgi:DNA primase